MEDGISETLHIASMGMDYTFKLATGSAGVLLDFLKYVCNKAVLRNDEKKALLQMMKASCNQHIKINKPDVKNFEKLLVGHGVKFTKFTPVISTNRDPGYTNFCFDRAQLAIVNACLREIGYGEIGDEKANTGDEKNAGASNRGRRERNTGSGGEQNTEEESQTFDAYEFTSNYDDEDIPIQKQDRVPPKDPTDTKNPRQSRTGSKVSEEARDVPDPEINSFVAPEQVRNARSQEIENPSVDPFTFLKEEETVPTGRDRVSTKNVFVAAKEAHEEQVQAKPDRMDPPDMLFVERILALGKDKAEALEKEKLQAVQLVKDGIHNAVATGKEVRNK